MLRNHKQRLGLILFACGIGLLLPSAQLNAQGIEAEAISGEPFGVGRITAIADPRGDDGSSPMLTDANGRVFYPTYSTLKVRKLLRQLVGAPRKINVYFLFQGTKPLDVTLTTGSSATVRLQP